MDGSCADTAWAELYSGRDIKVNRLEYVINDRKNLTPTEDSTLHKIRNLDDCILQIRMVKMYDMDI